MARKSRKHPHIDSIIKPCRDTVGYIRLSVRDNDLSGSIENQRLIIEEWGHQQQTPIMHYYVDNGFSGKRFDRPAFQQMIRDILDDKIECIVCQRPFPVRPRSYCSWLLPGNFLPRTAGSVCVCE